MNLFERDEKIRNFFNEKIDSYDQTHEKFMGTKKALVDNLDISTKTVLDLGAGTGLELIHLFEVLPEAEVTAVDITENMLEELNKREFANKVKTICGDFFKVDFGKDFDTCISTSALHHFKPEEKIVLYAKIYDSLVSNGTFFNCDKVASSQEEQDSCIYEIDHNIDAFKHNDTPLTVDNEIKLLEEAGFVDITVDNVDKDDYRLIKARKR